MNQCDTFGWKSEVIIIVDKYFQFDKGFCIWIQLAHKITYLFYLSGENQIHTLKRYCEQPELILDYFST